MADEHYGFTRRDAIRSAAVGAGLTWTAPAIKSIAVLQTPGTPAPPTSDTTTPTVTNYTFDGEVTQRDVVGIGMTEPGCFENGVVSFVANLSALGITTGEVEVCLTEFSDPFISLTGSGSLTAADGTLSVSVSGTVRPHSRFPDPVGPIVYDHHFDMTISGGTGVFDDAVGTAVYDDREVFVEPAGTVAFSGELSGSFDVPG